MQIDETIKEIALEIQSEIKKECNITISIEEILDIVSNFYKIGFKGFKKGFHLEAPYLGKFILPYADEITDKYRKMTKEEKKTDAKELLKTKKDSKISNKRVTTYKEFKDAGKY